MITFPDGIYVHPKIIYTAVQGNRSTRINTSFGKAVSAMSINELFKSKTFQNDLVNVQHYGLYNTGISCYMHA